MPVVSEQPTNLEYNNPTQPPVDKAGPVGGSGGESFPREVLVDTKLPFPVAGAATSYAPSGTAGSPYRLNQMVEGALREVLAYRPRTTDPRGFVAALNNAFTTVEVEGHTETRWSPRSYSVQIQSDMGAITGGPISLPQWSIIASW